MKRLQGFMVGVILTVVLLFSFPSMAENAQVLFNAVNIQINGTPTDIASISYNGSTYLKVRDVCNAVGKKVDWIEQISTVNILNPVEPKTALTFDNGMRYIGELENDIPNGKGVMILNEKTYYAGTFVNGKRVGKGYLVDTDGSVYFGEWKDDNETGKGYMVLDNGERYSVVMENGKTTKADKLDK